MYLALLLPALSFIASIGSALIFMCFVCKLYKSKDLLALNILFNIFLKIQCFFIKAQRNFEREYSQSKPTDDVKLKDKPKEKSRNLYSDEKYEMELLKNNEPKKDKYNDELGYFVSIKNKN